MRPVSTYYSAVDSAKIIREAQETNRGVRVRGRNFPNCIELSRG